MTKLILNIITPEKHVIVDKGVDFVVLPAYDGEMGVLPGHVPFVVQLKEGVLRYKSGQEEGIFAVIGGFAELAGDHMAVFAEAAELAEEIDSEKARQELQKAKDSLVTCGADMDINAAQAALKRAILRVKVSEMRKVKK